LRKKNTHENKRIEGYGGQVRETEKDKSARKRNRQKRVEAERKYLGRERNRQQNFFL